MESSTDTVQSATSTETLVRLLVAIACADDAVSKKHDLIFVQAADRLSTLQSELTRAREREKELVEALRVFGRAADRHEAQQEEDGFTCSDFDSVSNIDLGSLRRARALAGGKP